MSILRAGGPLGFALIGASMAYAQGRTEVRVGNGGPKLTLDTLNGDVRVLRRSN